ncbi:dipeptidase [Henriciella sp.]|uniref:dipeptidase n=1 Tax=Henriciella sp. TaxID=1968823 RepID=UPI0018153AFE|nr:dipeptidase [Henriciella sp.]HIG23307.1 membrane dipeptidase [Henriciella sp.]
MTGFNFRKGLMMAGALTLLAACNPDAEPSGSEIIAPAEAQSTAEVAAPMSVPQNVEAIHEGMLVMDTHLDTPAYFHTPDYNFSVRQSFEEDGTHVDLPRMKEGGLDGGFWVIFTAQGPLDEASYVAARNQALLRQMSIRELAAKYSGEVELAFTADDAARIAGEGKRVVYQSMENAYPLGTDVSLMEAFYIGGLRMIAPVHFRDSQFADSATDVSGDSFGGLSPLGEDLVRKANELGMILDGSHASDETVYDMIELSTTPLILSHTGVDGVYDHFRNIPDELLLAIGEDGGVIQINAYGGYLEALEPSPERQQAMADLEEQFGGSYYDLDDAAREEYSAARDAIDAQYPAPRSSFEKFMEHLLYALDLVGPDHVGMGADWDGGGGVEGMTDITFLPKVTAALLEAGYSEQDIEKFWSGNMLRLLRQAEEARTSELQSPNVLK